MCVSELRPHHGLCTLFFVGKGYSEDFSRNMREVIDQLKQLGSEVVLTDKEDCICAKCPHNCNGCVSSDSVCEFDSRVMELCGFTVGDTMKTEELYAHIQEDILEQRRLADVCGDCQWYSLCSGLLEQRE